MLKKTKIISLVLAVCLVIGSVNFYLYEGFGKINTMFYRNKDEQQFSKKTIKLAGKNSAKVMKLSSENTNFLTTIKDNDKIGKMTDDELASLLVKEDYSEKEISDTKSLVFSIVLNLDEILKNNNEASPINSVGFDKDDESTSYRKIGEAFDKNLAIYLALKLKEKLGSTEIVLDEYLYCLQVDVDLRLLLTNEKTYQKAILEKSINLSREKAITYAKIENYMLQQMHNPNKQSVTKMNQLSENEEPYKNAVLKNSSVQDYTTKNPTPKDPTQEVMDEINKINDSWKNVGR